jgi:beta-1,4-mannosyltransferase
MTKKNAFIYPPSGKSGTASNPYIEDFTACLSSEYNFINCGVHSNSSILNLYKYLNKTDIVFLNWIEDLPDKRGGIIQVIAFLIVLLILKVKKVRIFYTLHNKESHYPTYLRIKKIVRKSIFRYADFILCHSSEGLKILDNNNIKARIRYIPHPFKKSESEIAGNEKKYDILIWGAIRPYKGVDNFLRHIESRNLLNKYNTLIIGKIFPEEYRVLLDGFKSETIEIVNKFIDDDSLNTLIDQSKIVLFTYNDNSVLSSGALIYSLSREAWVIGPDAGSFRDLYREGIIETFDNYDELVEKIDLQLAAPKNNREKINHYVHENSWDSFGIKLADWINNNP